MFEEPSARRLGLIGGVCYQWSGLEFIIASLIWKMLGLQPAIGKIVTGGLDMRGRIGMAIGLAHATKQNKLLGTALREARKSLQAGLIDQRNLLVHGMHWHFQGDTPQVEVHRGAGDRRPQPFPDDHLMPLMENIHSITLSLANVAIDVGLIDRINLGDIDMTADKIRQTIFDS